MVINIFRPVFSSILFHFFWLFLLSCGSNQIARTEDADLSRQGRSLDLKKSIFYDDLAEIAQSSNVIRSVFVSAKDTPKEGDAPAKEGILRVYRQDINISDLSSRGSNLLLPLEFGSTSEDRAILSPDGEWVVISSYKDKVRSFVVTRYDQTLAPKVITNVKNLSPGRFSPDSKYFLMTSYDNSTQVQTLVLAKFSNIANALNIELFSLQTVLEGNEIIVGWMDKAEDGFSYSILSKTPLTDGKTKYFVRSFSDATILQAITKKTWLDISGSYDFRTANVASRRLISSYTLKDTDEFRVSPIYGGKSSDAENPVTVIGRSRSIPILASSSVAGLQPSTDTTISQCVPGYLSLPQNSDFKYLSTSIVNLSSIRHSQDGQYTSMVASAIYSCQENVDPNNPAWSVGQFLFVLDSKTCTPKPLYIYSQIKDQVKNYYFSDQPCRTTIDGVGDVAIERQLGYQFMAPQSSNSSGLFLSLSLGDRDPEMAIIHKNAQDEWKIKSILSNIQR